MAQDGDTIQTVTNANCPTIDTSVTTTDANAVWVKDARDNHTYFIGKIGGLCWMLTNLAYGGDGTDTYGDVLTFDSSSVFDGSITKPASTNATPQIATGAGGTAYTVDTSPVASAGSAADAQRGYLYNWCAAMGKQYSACAGGSNSGSDFNFAISICPYGWRLPIGNNGEFQALNIAANNNSTINDSGLRATWLGVYSGYYYGTLSFQGYGYYWSSTANSNASNAYILQIRADKVAPAGYNTKDISKSVRCVAAR
jgi:uncharacterized protein (TIGR02145 family)